MVVGSKYRCVSIHRIGLWKGKFLVFRDFGKQKRCRVMFLKYVPVLLSDLDRLRAPRGRFIMTHVYRTTGNYSISLKLNHHSLNFYLTIVR